MLEETKKYIGKTMTWEEIANLFPNCYVVLDEYHSEGHIVTAKLVFVCKKQEEMTDILKQYASNGTLLHTRYTTESKEWNGLYQL